MSNMNSQGAGSDAWVHSGAASTSMNSTLPDDILSFYPDSGLDTIAREAGVIEVEVATQETPAVIQPQKNKTFKIIAVTVPPKHQLTTQIAQQTPQFYFTSPTQIATELKTPSAPKFYQLVSPAKQTNQTSWAVPQIKKKPVDNLESYIPESRRRKGSHSGKGLRHFSMKVCEKVQRKQITSYNEVADELVNEIFDPATGESDQSFDQKNIRRRVYDALNVLMAMNIISKEKKEIKWIGLPTNSDQECQNLEAEKRDILERMKNKSQQLKELVQQQIAFKQLVERNRKACQTQGHPPPNTTIQLPFILLTTCKKTVIDCSISNDKYEFLFNFDQVFSIHDDIEVLKRMGLALNLDKGSTTEEELKKAMKMVPAALHNTLYEMTNRAKRIKLEPGTSSGFHADESLDGEVTWGGSMVTDASRQSSCASRSDQPSPDYTDSVDSD